MIKSIILMICSALFISSAIADNFNYTSAMQCKQAMAAYKEKAEELAKEYEPGSKDHRAFVDMALFFSTINENSSFIQSTCNGITCTVTFNPGCQLANPESNLYQAWLSSIAPRLNIEVNNYLNHHQADPDRPGNIYTKITCIYPQLMGINWSKCILS